MKTNGRAEDKNTDDDDLKEYNLDKYDEEDEPENSENEAQLGIFSNLKGLTYYSNNEEDPYITLKEVTRYVNITNEGARSRRRARRAPNSSQ